jgi:adenylosuccinate synthase
MRRYALNVVMGLQWGSEAKGKMVHWLSDKHEIAAATTNFGPNAGHTAVLDDGKKHVFKMLPVAALDPDTRLLLNPGSVIDIYRLLEEVETHKAQKRLMIHPHAAVVLEIHKTKERESLKHISSTQQGTAASMVGKMMRTPGATLTVLAKDCRELKEWIGDTTAYLRTFLAGGALCLAEGAQGFDLSINHGHLWPYCTSRDVTPSQILNDAGVPPQLIGDVYGCIRAFPIRVGHQMEKGPGIVQDPKGMYGKDDVMVKVGDSGPFYADQSEIKWEDLERMSDSKLSLVERTTVTNKIRRVFTFSETQFKKALRVCAPTHVFLNFINHVRAEDGGKRSLSELTEPSRQFVRYVEGLMDDGTIPFIPKPLLSHVGTGPKVSDMIELA